MSESTVRRERGLLQSIFERAIDDGYDIRNPFRGIKRGKDKPRTRVLTLDEETKLLDGLHPRFQRFVRFALGTGCRLDEIRGIDSKEDVDWIRGTVHVIGKFRKERDVPMQPDASAALKEQLEEEGKLCDISEEPYLAERLAFRGGTAINKLLFRQPLRYSEDIDLVQVRPEPIGKTVDAVRGALSWLGPCRRKSAAHSIHPVFSFSPEAAPETKAKLKVEINTREHENLYDIRTYPFAVENPWFSGKVTIASFEPEELFGTKLRALLQRRKGRDLFDLNEGLKQLSPDASKVIAAFNHYLAHEGTAISRRSPQTR